MKLIFVFLLLVAGFWGGRTAEAPEKAVHAPTYISEESVLAKAKAFGPYPDAEWSAKRVDNVEVPAMDGKITKHTVWELKAVFPHGGSTVIWYDAESGEELMFGENEAGM